MTTPETTLSPREVALREEIAEALYAATGIPVPWSVITSDPDFRLRAERFRRQADVVMAVYHVRCCCQPVPAYEGPERDCPIHGEPEVMLAEVTAERDHIANRVALAVETAQQRSETLYAARDRTPSDLRERRLRFEQVANELDAIRRILEPAVSRSEVRRRTIQQGGDRGQA